MDKNLHVKINGSRFKIYSEQSATMVLIADGGMDMSWYPNCPAWINYIETCDGDPYGYRRHTFDMPDASSDEQEEAIIKAYHDMVSACLTRAEQAKLSVTQDMERLQKNDRETA